MRFVHSTILAALLFGCSERSGPPVEYVIPDGFRGLFRISPNPNAPPIPFVDGRCIVDIPQSGLLLVRDMEPFRRFHSGAARYTSGALLPVAVSASTSEDIQLFYLSTDSDGNSWWLVGPGAREHACLTMRLEILTPRHWTHPSKNFLRQWYSRIGYVPKTTEPFESMYPELVPELATECDFTVWHKSLA